MKDLEGCQYLVNEYEKQLAVEKGSIYQNHTVFLSNGDKKVRADKIIGATNENGSIEQKKLELAKEKASVSQNDTVFLAHQVQKKDIQRNIDKGLKAEKIIGSSNKNGCIEFLIKFKGKVQAELIPSEIVKIKIPQQVIKYYEDRIEWYVNPQ